MGGAVGCLAHKILVTSPESKFLFHFGLGLGTWDSGLSIFRVAELLSLLLSKCQFWFTKLLRERKSLASQITYTLYSLSYSV